MLRLVTFIIAAACLVGCGESDKSFFTRLAQYRDPVNSARLEKSIPTVPSDWVPRSDRSAAAWDNPAFVRNRKVPGHQYKFLTFSDQFTQTGSLVSETDHYESGKVWQDPAEGTQTEFIRITYSYEDERAGKNPWRAEVHREETGLVHEITSLEAATEILRRWGISRQ
jgi:hypothetical protein